MSTYSAKLELTPDNFAEAQQLLYESLVSKAAYDRQSLDWNTANQYIRDGWLHVTVEACDQGPKVDTPQDVEELKKLQEKDPGTIEMPTEPQTDWTPVQGLAIAAAIYAGALVLPWATAGVLTCLGLLVLTSRIWKGA